MGKVLMAILAMLMFSGAVEAKRIVVATFGVKIHATAVDKPFIKSGEKADNLYDWYIVQLAFGRPVRQEFRKFLRKRARVCEQWVEKKAIDYCKEPLPPAESDTLYSECQTEVYYWVYYQIGCNFDEFVIE